MPGEQHSCRIQKQTAAGVRRKGRKRDIICFKAAALATVHNAHPLDAAGVDERYLVSDARERRCWRRLLWFMGRFEVCYMPSPLRVLVCRGGPVNNDLGALETAFYVCERLAFASRGNFSFGLRHLLVAEAWRGNLDDEQKPAQAPRRVV